MFSFPTRPSVMCSSSSSLSPLLPLTRTTFRLRIDSVAYFGAAVSRLALEATTSALSRLNFTKGGVDLSRSPIVYTYIGRGANNLTLALLLN